MKPIKIECPSCQQQIEIVPPKPGALLRTVLFILTLILGGVLTIGGFYAWMAWRLSGPSSSYTRTKEAVAKIPIEGAFGWKLGDQLPVNKDEMTNKLGITYIPFLRDEQVFPMPQICALPDRRIYAIDMNAEASKESIVQAALEAKYGPGQRNWDSKSGTTIVWTNGTREINFHATTYGIFLRYSDRDLEALSWQHEEQMNQNQSKELGGHL